MKRLRHRKYTTKIKWYSGYGGNGKGRRISLLFDPFCSPKMNRFSLNHALCKTSSLTRNKERKTKKENRTLLKENMFQTEVSLSDSNP